MTWGARPAALLAYASVTESHLSPVRSVLRHVGNFVSTAAPDKPALVSRQGALTSLASKRCKREACKYMAFLSR